MKEAEKRKEEVEKEADKIRKEEKEEKERELEKKLENCLKERKEYLEGWQRERADFLNYKKEQEKISKEIFQKFKEELIKNFLIILDNFDLILKEENLKNLNEEIIKGLLLIKSQFLDVLKKEGLKEIEVREGDKFNPEIHEAVILEEKGEEKKDRVIEVLVKGYLLDGKVIRPAKVKVGK